MLAATPTPVASAPAANDAAIWKQIAEPVYPFLESVSTRLQEQVHAFEPEIAAYAQYALAAQGKQLRPTLVALAAGSVGKVNDAHVTAAVIIEMVHLATLVHDDILDEADIRRGRPTLAANWGNELSVLLGDCLFAQALTLAASFPTPHVCRAVAQATNTVCSGEILQTQRRRNFQMTRPEYFRILAMKTGELFALSCELGGFLADASAAHQKALREYGMQLGTAYQIYDDCLDVFGSESVAGKSLGTDLVKGKLTLPILITLERGSPSERAHVQEQLKKWREEWLPEVIALLERHHALPESKEVMAGYLAAARKSLGQLPAAGPGQGLDLLAGFLQAQINALAPRG